jgi:hypothetical protein
VEAMEDVLKKHGGFSWFNSWRWWTYLGNGNSHFYSDFAGQA